MTQTGILQLHSRWGETCIFIKSITSHEFEMCDVLCEIEKANSATHGHNIARMSRLSGCFSRLTGLGEGETRAVVLCSMLHDIGKVGIINYIISKAGRLDDAELQIMRSHPQIGNSILSKTKFLLIKCAADTALFHHEKYDGTGYPTGIKGSEIPLYARIIAVADVLDAMLSERSYRAATTLSSARDYMIDQRGGHFDPMCIDPIIEHWDDVANIVNEFTE